MSQSLHKIIIHENKNYVRSAPKSYAWLLNKYSLTPPKESPYYRAELDEATRNTPVRDIAHQRFLSAKQHPVGRLMKKTAANDRGRHVVTEDIQQDTLYLSEVVVKGQKQPFHLDFDSGSSDLFILSKELVKDFPQASKHNLFDKSVGFHPLPDEHFEIHFGDGSFAKGSVGNVGTADLLIGGLTVRNQAIEVANNVAKSFITGAGDGLLGLAWGSINSVVPRQVLTPVNNMIAQDDIPRDQELFTCKLGSFHDKDEPDKGESFYTFGFIDQPTVDAGKDKIWYADIVHDDLDSASGFWRFMSESIVVNGQSFARDGNTAIADTGTTLALISDDALQAIYKQIPGARIGDPETQESLWIYPEDTKPEDLPVISIDVGGKQFVVQKEDLAFASAGPGWVFGAIQSRGPDDKQPFDILGDAFLKNIYAIFDQGHVQQDGTKGRFGAVQRKELHQDIRVSK